MKQFGFGPLTHEWYIFGGKVDIPWDGPTEGQTYITDEDAYLFQLKPKIIKRKAVEAHGKQVLHHKNIGPAFGDDLILFEGDVGAGEATVSRSTKTNGTAGEPAAYEKKDGWRPSFDLLDIEVCEITDEDIDILDNEYAFAQMEEPKEERDDLMKRIRNYVPPKSVRTSFARLLLLGPVGAGKSSFINTVNSAFRERITQKASSGTTNYSLTQRYQVYEIRPDREEPPLNFRLCDTMGIEPEDGKGLLVEDVPFVLDGSMHEGTEFNPARPVSANKDRLIQGATILNKIHCAAVFVNANTLQFMPTELRKKLKQLCKHIMDADIPLVGLLTHIDEACPHVKKDLTLIYIGLAIQDGGPELGV
ncbi:Interferon-induced protein 44-like [Branchiostoma belcheri]|nr:Interferon-induced protein 44-like [Branchiostoma belcheri]